MKQDSHLKDNNILNLFGYENLMTSYRTGLFFSLRYFSRLSKIAQKHLSFFVFREFFMTENGIMTKLT